MPTYEYECYECKSILTVSQKISEEALETIEECPECKKKNCQLKKLISTPHFIIKGYRKQKRGTANFTPEYDKGRGGKSYELDEDWTPPNKL